MIQPGILEPILLDTIERYFQLLQAHAPAAEMYRRSETTLGRRGAVTLAILLAAAVLPLYLYARDPWFDGSGRTLDGDNS